MTANAFTRGSSSKVERRAAEREKSSATTEISVQPRGPALAGGAPHPAALPPSSSTPPASLAPQHVTNAPRRVGQASSGTSALRRRGDGPLPPTFAELVATSEHRRGVRPLDGEVFKTPWRRGATLAPQHVTNTPRRVGQAAVMAVLAPSGGVVAGDAA